MLKILQLKNIALIDYAEIDFEKGLNVLSGETGSGKSVIIDSINFVLGAKADKTMIRYGESECDASAVFEIDGNSEVIKKLSGYDIECDGELILKRKLSSDGKSSVKVNGENVTLSMLREITSELVDVHGQSEHYSLLKTSAQLEIVDKFSGEILKKAKDYIIPIIKRIKEIDEEIKSFGGNESERAMRADILKFQTEEIKNADISDGEEKNLLIKREKIRNAEKIAEALNVSHSALSDENCAEDMINSAYRALSGISGFDEKYSELSQRLESVKTEISDISETLWELSDSGDFDAAEAERIENRLDTIKTLKKKYGNSEKEILEFLEKAENEYEKLNSFDTEYAKITAEKSELLNKLNKGYAEISRIRKESSNEFSSLIIKELKELSMKSADFEVAFGDLKETDGKGSYPLNGVDEIEFMFSANKGEPLKSLSKIISGGEMSRFMLALKTQISRYQDISTYIFDEIDAGISGAVAQVVAEKFAKIAKNIQIIAISHLPQICSMSDNSYLIYKTETENKTFTSVKKLDKDSKVNEIIRLVGGANDSEVAKLHAVEMIKYADNFKSKI